MTSRNSENPRTTILILLRLDLRKRGSTLVGRGTSPGVPFVLFLSRRYKVGGPLQWPNAVFRVLVNNVNMLPKGRGFLRGPNIRYTQILDGGELGTRTLNAKKHNGFQDRPTTNYHNSPKKKGAGRHPSKEAPFPCIFF